MNKTILSFFLFFNLNSLVIASDYDIRLINVPPLKVGPTTYIGTRLDDLNSDQNRGRVVVEIYEYYAANDSNLRWVYSFHNLLAGSEIALMGKKYLVDSINYNHSSSSGEMKKELPLGLGAELLGGCNQHCDDFVGITSEGSDISTSKNETIVLEKGYDVTFYDYSPDMNNSSELHVKFDSFGIDSSGKYYGIISWRRRTELSNFSMLAQNHDMYWSSDWFQATVHLGKIIDLPHVGRFRVESILPSQKGRTDWMVIVPEKKSRSTIKGQRR
ncbi:hypothetical protein IHE49_15760 [Rhodanobacter sp. 7MK24]|uniref:hypothetical protein n=1 Tax=Rhodanobacter sp. 7MK24 TaxID=2775922 RepID=UPI00177E7195|nr:hypothetical protein [Rhodanobacter sp. 7MK24]MBD8881940.1 hypothetical protein [Rhodanobacter sp. 7MK24]